MSDPSQFITTIKELMRLTRKGKIDWEERSPESSNAPPSFKGTYKNLKFIIKEDSVGKSVLDDVPNKTWMEKPSSTDYIIEIEDKSDNSQITSPPMKAVRDLVHVIRSKPNEKKLSEINRRLGAS